MIYNIEIKHYSDCSIVFLLNKSIVFIELV